MEDDSEDYDSGTFCRHYADPSDCEERCICGHKCPQHDYEYPGPCMECGCVAFTIFG